MQISNKLSIMKNLKFLFVFIFLTSSACLIAQEESYKIPNVIDVIHSRKSVRTYSGKHVSDEKLEILLRAGMAAPSAMNKQPWFFILVNDTILLKELGGNIMFATMLNQASAAIVVCGNMKNVSSVLPEYWVQDCSAATENILLAAEGIGLGAVWVGLYPAKERVKKVRKVLNMPNHLVPLCVVSIGYPTGIEKPKNKWDPDKIHKNKW